ncbi:HlyD family type I secretion periplasmic adaptor subunit [Falsirhodobacter deserti]|uniref:HlyD family type I secretion periplasmic adaptor subunit n=1 Tax=Falsirhodobacter deserti TaxID=1365611 RepID=UPI000FE32F77|nr:HlyD family type I secretion periplasmic adaptor subunit [Falsirhodobacter deserti]
MTFAIRTPVLFGLGVLALLVAGFGAWAMLARIDGAVVAPAEIRVTQNRQLVQHPDGGVVDHVAVLEGQAVQAGDLLVRLNGADLRFEHAVVQGKWTELTARRARLEAERDGAATVVFPAELTDAKVMSGQRALFSARADTLAAQLDQLSRREAQVADQITGILAQKEAGRRQAELVADDLADQRELLKQGLTQRARVRALEREEARLEGEMGALAAREAEARGRISEYRLQALGLASQRREEAISRLRDIEHQRGELAERRRALSERIARLEVRAPIAGRVLGLTISPKAVLKPAEPLLEIVPQDDPLFVQARIPPLNVDEVWAGQTVRLVLPAFSARTMPELEGRVIQVTPDTMHDDQGNSFYLARIELAVPEGLVLTPGMPAEAFIRTGSRSPMAYLLHPLTSYFDRAFRES